MQLSGDLESDLICSCFSLQESLDLCHIFWAEIHLLPSLTHKGHVALQRVCKGPRRSTETLDLALLGKLAQVQQRQVGKLWKGDAAGPLRQMLCK